MTWLLILQVAITGQWVVLDVPQGKERCEYMLSEVHRTGGATVTLNNGVLLSIEKGIACMTEEEFMARQSGAGA